MMSPILDMLGGSRRPTTGVAQDELPPGWDTARAKDADTVYYINQWTRILQTELPTTQALPQGWDIAASRTTGCEYYINAGMGQMSTSFDDVVRSLAPEGSQLPAKKSASSSAASSTSPIALGNSAAKAAADRRCDALEKKPISKKPTIASSTSPIALGNSATKAAADRRCNTLKKKPISKKPAIASSTSPIASNTPAGMIPDARFYLKQHGQLFVQACLMMLSCVPQVPSIVLFFMTLIFWRLCTELDDAESPGSMHGLQAKPELRLRPESIKTTEADTLNSLAKVLYEYEAEDETNITIRAGDTVVVTEKSNADWWEGYVAGDPDAVGFFPASFVELIDELRSAKVTDDYEAEDKTSTSASSSAPDAESPRPSDRVDQQQRHAVPVARALFDYEAADGNDLPLTAGMEIELKDTSDADWWSGSPRSRPEEVGFFPASFVEKIEDAGEGSVSTAPAGRHHTRSSSEQFKAIRDDFERQRIGRTDERASHRGYSGAPNTQCTSDGPPKAGADVRFYLEQAGLGAWIGHFERHLPANIKSVKLVRATTVADLQRMANKANMRLDLKTRRQVLNALKKTPIGKEALGAPNTQCTSDEPPKAGADVRFYLQQAGLGAWIGHFERYLPANIKSVKLVRATTVADLQRMANKANMRLDLKTRRQVLNALKKTPIDKEALGVAFWNFSDSTVEVYQQQKFVASLVPNSKHGLCPSVYREGACFHFRLSPTADGSPEAFAVWSVTDHHTQQVVVEGSALDELSLNAIVCHNTHPRYDDHRMRAVELITDELLVESKRVTVQAICERGNLQQYADSSRQQKQKQCRRQQQPKKAESTVDERAATDVGLRKRMDQIRCQKDAKLQLQKHSQNATEMLVEICEALGLTEADYERFKDAPISTTARLELISTLKSRLATAGVAATTTSKHGATPIGYPDSAQLKNVISDVKQMLSTVPCRKAHGTMHNDTQSSGTHEIHKKKHLRGKPELNEDDGDDAVVISHGRVERAKVTFDYEAEDETNITISVGDVVVVTDKSDADWWEGHLEGRENEIGFFPASFVELIDGDDAVVISHGRVERAKVTFDYEAEDDTNITISVGDVVVVTDKSDADWWEGHLEGRENKIGFFPASFVELIEDGGHVGEYICVTSSGFDAGCPRSSVGGVERAKVTFDYEAEDDTNITISVGDVVVLTDKSDADWWEGHLEGRENEIGFFPASFVELIGDVHQRSGAAPLADRSPASQGAFPAASRTNSSSPGALVAPPGTASDDTAASTTSTLATTTVVLPGPDSAGYRSAEAQDAVAEELCDRMASSRTELSDILDGSLTTSEEHFHDDREVKKAMVGSIDNLPINGQCQAEQQSILDSIASDSDEDSEQWVRVNTD